MNILHKVHAIMFVYSVNRYSCNHEYNSYCKARVQPFTKGSEDMDEMNTTMALLRAVLELIAKCETLEELRESVKRIMGE